MIIFTVTNTATSQVYVGSTRNDLVDQWEKMVAAAEQNLDYPLYQEIRTHGRDGFTVEEWDYVDDRGELAALEQEALEIFGAKSLKGYKTSTVKIQPKKKVRARKSSIEKELASLFTEAPSDIEEELPNLTVKPASETAKEPEKAKPATTSKSPLSKPKEQYTQAEIDRLTQAVAEAKKAEAQKAEEPKKAAPPTPDNCSQANAVVQMNNINLSDDISAQLAAIQAAADAVLAGDTESASNLSAQPTQIPEMTTQEPEVTNVVPIQEPVAQPEPLDPKEQLIREAIERHRKYRAQKTSDSQNEERKQIAKLLAELDSRALALNHVHMAA